MIEYGLFAIYMAIGLSFLWGIAIGLLVSEVWLAHYRKKLKIYEEMGKNKMKEEVVDVIETNIMFAVDINVNVKVRKVTSFGNPQPEYELAEVANVAIQSDIFDEDTKMDIVRNIREEAFAAVHKYEKEIAKKC